jgi:hypothetical protein
MQRALFLSCDLYYAGLDDIEKERSYYISFKGAVNIRWHKIKFRIPRKRRYKCLFAKMSYNSSPSPGELPDI